MSSDFKLLFIGEPGAGKSTCIQSVSDIDPISTDVECTDELAEIKDSTTVALDYGELTLGDGNRLLLYGLPGQQRFRFMFDVVRQGLLGVALLVDGSGRDPIRGMIETLETYADEFVDLPLVVAVNKLDLPNRDLLQQCLDVLSRFDLVAPVVTVDVRKRDDVARIFDLLFMLLEQSDLATQNRE